jgi:hypothetical protein
MARPVFRRIVDSGLDVQSRCGTHDSEEGRPIEVFGHQSFAYPASEQCRRSLDAAVADQYWAPSDEAIERFEATMMHRSSGLRLPRGLPQNIFQRQYVGLNEIHMVDGREVVGRVLSVQFTCEPNNSPSLRPCEVVVDGGLTPLPCCTVVVYDVERDRWTHVFDVTP